MIQMSGRLCPITSPKLEVAGFRHAFFTNAGGVSCGPYATLNLSNSVGDSPANVAENLARAANWLGIATSGLCWPRQVHGRDVLVVDNSASPNAIRTVNGDAVIASDAHVACCVRTADCVPILIADRNNGRVAAVHAGWRGIVAGIIPQTLARLRQLGSKPDCLVAAIGPHIRAAAFEVSEDVACLISDATPCAKVISRNYGERPHVALVQSATEQLHLGGLDDEQIDDVGGCTFEESGRFFSYRRSGPASGRHLHAILPGSQRSL